MSASVAINGYGRIGRSILRAIHERADTAPLHLVAINEPADPEAVALLTRYDSSHGPFKRAVSHDPSHLIVDDQAIRLLPGQEPAHLPWEALGIDLVLECTGLNADRSTGQAHLDAGSRRILFSQPATPDMDITVIHGFNHEAIRSSHRILSAGSCTTNCLLPLLDILQASFGFRHGTATTLHAAMNDQPVTDTLRSNSLRLSRAALNGMVPVDTALARGITRLKPELEGRIDCTHLRLPTTAVSAMDITVVVEKPTTRAAVEQALTDAASGTWRDRLGVCDDPVSSVDFAHDPRSGIVDLTQIRVVDDRVVKLLCWFDNEWGFANRMVDIALQLTQLDQSPRG
ncbi:MAG: glyceraldehyde 3-phosphate dehydrogenase NAD-binding domain-containing protein [Spiribacter sp.]|nr:glyceraldehyde 3-phosphate dehydrogenase NAD-binding domain-containing protein [Spiribacter sp.]